MRLFVFKDNQKFYDELSKREQEDFEREEQERSVCSRLDQGWLKEINIMWNLCEDLTIRYFFQDLASKENYTYSDAYKYHIKWIYRKQ